MEHAPPDRPQPPRRGLRDLLISLLVLLVPVVVLVGGYQVISGRDRPVAVDPAPELAAAIATGMPAVAPTGLDSGWTAVSAAFQERDAGATLRIGYATPDGGSVQLIQSTVPVEELLPAELAGAGPPGGTVVVAGRDWQRYPSRPGQQALVLLEPELTTLVVGSADVAELTALAASLR